MKLDLHGYRVHDAWHVFKRHIEECYHYKYKHTTIVTGHGKISEEIESWCRTSPYVRHVERMSPNTGAYKLTFWKQKSGYNK